MNGAATGSCAFALDDVLSVDLRNSIGLVVSDSLAQCLHSLHSERN